MLLDEIAQYLADNSIGTYDESAQDIFVGKMPEQPTNAIMLMTVPSPSPNRYLPNEELTFEVWCRDKSTLNGWNRLRDIHTLLHRKGNFALPSYYVYFAKSTDQIQDMDEDQSGHKLQKLPLQFLYRDLQAQS